MDLAHVVLLIATAIAIAAIAGYLIAIALTLRHVVRRLVTVLGAVEATTETAEPVGAIIDDINRDLEVGRKLIENGVERLEESQVPVAATGESTRHTADRPPWEGETGGTATATAAPPPPAPSPEEAAEPPPEEPPPGASGRAWWQR